MIIIDLFENSSYTLPESYYDMVSSFINNTSGLPINLKNKTLFFDPYIVGSIRIDDLVINIHPRIKNLTINHYLEMELYNEGLLDEKVSSLLSENEGYGVQENLVSVFLNETFLLATKGIEGEFITIQETSNKIRGKIQPSKITPLNLVQDLIPMEYEIHTLNTSSNKIIKLALNKIKILINKKSQSQLYATTNSYFEDIDAEISELEYLISVNKEKSYFVNDKYPIVIGLAIKILKELKINLRSNKVSSSAYLVNSNTLFENYCRKVLSNNLKSPVSKWDKPKEVGGFRINTIFYPKSYSPDVIIDYHHDTNKAYAVLDVKNKDISDYKNIGSLSDLYQIIFYANSLECNYAGLIYPTAEKLDPVWLSLDSFKEISLHIFSIDFSKKLPERNKIFIDAIKEKLLIQN